MLLVKRTKANLFRIEHVVFVPGITELKNEADIKLVQKHPTYQALLKAGVMIELDEKPISSVAAGDDVNKKESTSDITEMNARSAIAIIQETYSIVILEDMHAREVEAKGRKSVLNTIEDQIKEMRSADNKDKE